jgi:hypothetical protein
MELLTNNNCLEIIRRLSKKYCIKPNAITEKLLSEEDKEDMRNGNLSIEALEAHIKVWVANGMPNYRNPNSDGLWRF